MNYILRRKWVGNPTTLHIASFSNKFSVHSTNDGEPPNPQGGVVFRWGTTSTIPGEGVTVNTAKAIHRVYDKRESRRALCAEGLSPKSWFSYEDFLANGGEEAIHDGGLVIVRPNHHIRGQDMDLCKNNLQVYQACQKYEAPYISTYIKKVKEFRVFVVSGRVLGICEKIPTNKNDVSWGCADEEGGSFKYINWSQWNMEMAEKAVRAARMMKIDFTAIDVIQATNEGGFYILELNSAPSMPKYWAECFAKAFDYIIDNGKEFIPVHPDGDWKSYIHPALTDNAKVA